MTRGRERERERESGRECAVSTERESVCVCVCVCVACSVNGRRVILATGSAGVGGAMWRVACGGHLSSAVAGVMMGVQGRVSAACLSSEARGASVSAFIRTMLMSGSSSASSSTLVGDRALNASCGSRLNDNVCRSNARGGKGGSCSFATRIRAEPASKPYQPVKWFNVHRVGSADIPKRVGCVAVKCGMTQLWDKFGVRMPVTVLWIDGCEVTQVKTVEKEGYSALQVGAGNKRAKQVTSPERGHFESKGINIKRKVAEFRVAEEELLPLGTQIGAQLFSPGQYLDITGISIGKGFQGAMKRHGFSGGNASHGASKSHRTLGSTGQCQDPGRVFKGKKMAGRMGGKRRTVQVSPQRDKITESQNCICSLHFVYLESC